jgi:hypothetical protein
MKLRATAERKGKMVNRRSTIKPSSFGGFEDSRAAAGRRRRKTRWSLRPAGEGQDSQAPDAGRFITKAKLYEGLGRRKPE